MTIRFLGILFAGLLFAQSVWALPPEHEIRRLMLAVEEAVEQGQWQQAGQHLNQLQALKGQKPPSYQYFRGRVMHEAGQSNEAREALESYVTQAGAEAPHYDRALKLITQIESAQRQSVRADEGSGEPVAVIKPAAGNRIEKLKDLYLAETGVDALEAHLNSLLELNAWRRGNQKVIRQNEPADRLYRVFAHSGSLNVQEQRRDRQGRSKVTSNEFPVYGVSPDVSWDCPQAGRACWIYDPRDGSRWMKLADKPDAARDVAETLGDLIRELQSP